MTDLGAVVLAGGGSTRMGVPKATLPYLGRPLLSHVLDCIAQECEPVVVVAAQDSELPELRSDVLRVDDPPRRAAAGPLSALLTGLEILEDHNVRWAYLSGCDTVGISRVHIRWMSKLAIRSDDQFGSVVVEPDSLRSHPLCSVVRVDLARKRANALVQAGESRAQALFARERAVRCRPDELPDPAVLRSCNTPEQWREVTQGGAGRSE